ncbi:MAG: acylphosphatase [Candidatus Aenigmarchaeota archaeon]|nr:acylphosphatase [Candidatus Aenigmarchaeota archaeon]
MKARAHVWISGEVQGVFFRSHIRSQAMLREIRGWVKNLPDGRVEALFEGNKDRIEELLEFCKEGPTGADVNNVEVKWEKPTSGFREFDIRY